jgi:hypothetical protein
MGNTLDLNSYKGDSNNKRSKPSRPKLRKEWNERLIAMEEESKARAEAILFKQRSKILKNEFIDHLTELMNTHNKRGLELLFVEWGVKIGFKNEALANWAAKDYLNLARTIYNTWLQYQPNCKTRIRTSKVKKFKHGFEKPDVKKTTYGSGVDISTEKKRFEYIGIKKENPELTDPEIAQIMKQSKKETPAEREAKRIELEIEKVVKAFKESLNN